MRKKKKEEITELLSDKDYEQIDDDVDYKYLVKMPMDSVSEENVEKLLNERNSKAEQLEQIKNTTIEQMWMTELEILEQEYQEYLKERKRITSGEQTNQKNTKATITKTGVKKIVKKTTNAKKVAIEFDEK